MLRKAALLLSGNAAAALLTLARNLLVARLIPVADYGIAATLAVAMAVVEMVSALGLQQQIVQARDGEDTRFQAALQGFQLLRGLAAGAAMLALAVPLAGFLRIPEAAWGYMALAAVPVLNALQHFDIHRLTRTMRFGPMILTGVIPAAVALAAVWPLALWLGDWRVMLASLLLQAVLAALVSHLAAERPFRLVFDRAEMGRSFRFGWPLLLNGALLFLVFNGDKLIVGRVLGMETLAVFAMGVTLTLTPTLVMAKSVQNLFLPRLSAADRATPEGAAQFRRLALAAQQALLAMGLALVAGTALAGGPVVHALLGPKYADLLPLLTLMAVAQALRVARAAPAIVALATGETTNALVANIGRALALGPAAAVAVATGDLRLVLATAVAGEILAHLVALWRAAPVLPPGSPGILRPGLASLAVLAAAVALAPPPGPAAAPPWVWAMLLLLLGLAAAAMRELRVLLRPARP
jgi:O-antigen/teichoic acid export membrane protein